MLWMAQITQYKTILNVVTLKAFGFPYELRISSVMYILLLNSHSIVYLIYMIIIICSSINIILLLISQFHSWRYQKRWIAGSATVSNIKTCILFGEKNEATRCQRKPQERQSTTEKPTPIFGNLCTGNFIFSWYTTIRKNHKPQY